MLDVLKAELQLVGIDLLRAPAVQRTLQLLEQKPQLLDFRLAGRRSRAQAIMFAAQAVALGPQSRQLQVLLGDQPAKRGDLALGPGRSFHDPILPGACRCASIAPGRPEFNLSHRIVQIAVAGRAVHAGIRQSIPSHSIESCADVNATVPSRACGHTKRPFSSRLA